VRGPPDRDFLDVVMLRGRYGGARLLELAAEKTVGSPFRIFVNRSGRSVASHPSVGPLLASTSIAQLPSTPLSRNGALNWRVDQVRIRSGHFVCPTAALHTTTLIVETEL
jgi:hypothetical protein